MIYTKVFTTPAMLIFFLHILKNSQVSNIYNFQESKTSHNRVSPENV